MDWLLATLLRLPFVTLFLVVAAGYAVGRLQVRGIGLGSTAATLLVALGLSLLAAGAVGGDGFSIPDFASTIFFNLFMFSVGMKVGPQFLVGLRRDARSFVLLGLLVPALSVGLMFVMREVLPLPPGMAPGVFAGANTATPGLGAAQAAYASRDVTGGAVASNLSTAFAFAYCLSVVLFTLLMKVPDLLGRDTAAAARRFEASLHKGDDDEPLPGTADEFFGRPLPVTLRAYEIEHREVTGHTLRELRQRHPRVSVERILRGPRILEPADDVVLQLHDRVALYGRIELLAAAGPRIGPEVFERTARDVGAQTVDVVVQKENAARRRLGDLAADIGHGLYLNGMFRAGDAIPHGPETVVEKGDVLRVTGSQFRLKILEREVGQIVRPSVSTDLVTLALGVALGAALGAITVPLGDLRLQLGSAVGLLVIGMGLSILRTRNPAFGGPYPEPARQLIEDLGLNVFVAVLGLNAGAGVIAAASGGAIGPILLACLIVGFIPPVIGWLVGLKLLRMNDALLLGAVAGARCNSPGMRAAQETTRSTVPAISYPATFALSNIAVTLLTYVLALIDVLPT